VPHGPAAPPAKAAIMMVPKMLRSACPGKSPAPPARSPSQAVASAPCARDHQVNQRQYGKYFKAISAAKQIVKSKARDGPDSFAPDRIVAERSGHISCLGFTICFPALIALKIFSHTAAGLPDGPGAGRAWATGLTSVIGPVVLENFPGQALRSIFGTIMIAAFGGRRGGRGHRPAV